MPTYKNTNADLAIVQGVRMEAGQEVASDAWLTNLPSGIIKTSDNPFVDPILYSKVITSTETITVPAVTGGYRLLFQCTVGAVAIKFNSTDAIALNLSAGASYSLACRGRVYDTVIVTISSGTVVVIIEKT